MIRNLRINRKYLGYMPMVVKKEMSPPNVLSRVVNADSEISRNCPRDIKRDSRNNTDTKVIYRGYMPKETGGMMLPPNVDTCVESIASTKRR